MRNAVLGLFLFLGFSAFSQCPNPTVMLFEDFEGGSPIPGAIIANIYGGGSWTNAAYIISGANHGWFNVVNGVGNVDVYDRSVTGFCQDSLVNVSFWTRESFGGTNVTYSVIDDFGVVLATTTLALNSTYQQVNFNFPATTPGIRFVIHCNSTGGSGVDIVIEDILITHCYSSFSENVLYGGCTMQTPTDLFSLFSGNIVTGGTWTGPSALSNGSQGTFDPNVNVNGTYTYTLNTGCLPSVSTVDVGLAPPIDLGNDTTLCQGSNLTLDAGAGYDSYSWSTNATTQTINVNQAGTYSVEASLLQGNIVLNGDFEGGTTNATNNFTTSYIPGTGGAWGLLSNPGEYAITTSPNLVHNNFPVCGDHTTGFGNMMVANGASVANTVVWSQTVPITPNTDYSFSYWAMRVSNDPATSDLQLYINGLPIGPVNSTGAVCLWLQAADIWNSGAATSAVLNIVNQSTSGSGNDFALDDISLSPICVVMDTIVVDIEVPSQTITVVNPACAGDANGEIHVDNLLATEYSFDGGITWQSDSFLLSLPQNVYNVCSRSALGCLVCENVNLVDPQPVLLTVSNDTTICENGTVNLAANATGGTTFLYHWDQTGDTGPFQTESPVVNTTYTVFAENENGCVSLPETIDVTILPPLTGTITAPASICPGESVYLEATVAGGIGGPYNFVWSNGDNANVNGIHGITVQPNDTTTYTVTIIDACESTPLVMTTTVNVAPLPVPQYEVTNPFQCEPAVFEIINTTDPALSQFVYWLIDGEYEYVNQDTILTPALLAGDYDIQMIVTSFDGCVDSLTFINALIVQPKPTAAFNYSPNPVQMFNTQVIFSNSSLNATSYEWFFEWGTPATSTATNPTVIFPDGVTGEYDVMLVATSDLGCTDTVVLQVIVYPEVLIYAPNAFTPDDDEFNQNWRVYMEGIDVYDFELYLYNRWGELIWESHDLEVAWDGTYKGKVVQNGTYNWKIRAKDVLNDGQHEFHGSVSVIK